MARPIWRGAISFGMVTIPVGLYTAVGEKDLRFHQIHDECGSRIKLHKYCPACERTVEPQELQRGYEFSKGQYVIMEESDFEDVPVPSKHTITVDTFVEAGSVDPVFYDRSYYIQPEEAGRKPFALLMEALKQKGLRAVAKIALRDKEHLCLLILTGDKLILETLFWPDEIREAAPLGIEEIKVDEKELKMALSLVELLEGEFEPERYQDEYREALMKRIEAKVQGKEIQVQPEVAAGPKVVDLMDALRASLEQAKAQKRKAG